MDGGGARGRAGRHPGAAAACQLFHVEHDRGSKPRPAVRLRRDAPAELTRGLYIGQPAGRGVASRVRAPVPSAAVGVPSTTSAVEVARVARPSRRSHEVTPPCPSRGLFGAGRRGGGRGHRVLPDVPKAPYGDIVGHQHNLAGVGSRRLRCRPLCDCPEESSPGRGPSGPRPSGLPTTRTARHGGLAGPGRCLRTSVGRPRRWSDPCSTWNTGGG